MHTVAQVLAFTNSLVYAEYTKVCFFFCFFFFFFVKATFWLVI